jgi:hypothetical protein
VAEFVNATTTDWSNCTYGSVIAFEFQPLYVSSIARGYHVYDYQYINGKSYVIHTTSYVVGDYTFTPPQNGEDDALIGGLLSFSCIGKVCYKAGYHVEVDILYAVRH